MTSSMWYFNLCFFLNHHGVIYVSSIIVLVVIGTKFFVQTTDVYLTLLIPFLMFWLLQSHSVDDVKPYLYRQEVKFQNSLDLNSKVAESKLSICYAESENESLKQCIDEKKPKERTYEEARALWLKKHE